MDVRVKKKYLEKGLGEICSTSHFGGKHFIVILLFMKITTYYFNALFPFIFRYFPVYMNEATLNANNNVDIS